MSIREMLISLLHYRKRKGIEDIDEGLKLPCIPLLDEIEVYRKMGRFDKVKLIEDYLN